MAAFAYADFATTTGLTLEGDTVGNVSNGIDAGKVLRVVPSSGGKVGRAFYTTKVDIQQFTTTVKFRFSNQGGNADVNGNNGADGLVFCVHNMATLPPVIGSFGYAGITPSIAVEFDTYCNARTADGFVDASHGFSSHVGINVNGSFTSLMVAQITPDMDNAALLHEAVITYRSNALKVVLDGVAVMTYGADIPKDLAGTTASVGLTAFTGGAWANHDVISWSFESLSPTNAKMFVFSGGSA